MIVLLFCAIFGIACCTPVVEPRPRDVTRRCGSPADVAFLLDDSRSIWGPHFTDMLNFCVSLVGEFDVSSAGVHVAAASFSRGAREEFAFGSYGSVLEVQGALSAIRQSNGDTTQTWAGLRFIKDTTFKTARAGVPHILIIITDGVSADRAETLKAAQEVMGAAIEVIVIGVGKLDQAQLTEMASKPVADHFFLVDDFKDLSGIESLVAVKTCQASNDQPQAQQVCQKVPAEIALVIDRSTSIARADFAKQLNFTANLIALFDVSQAMTRVAAVSFSTDASVEFHLDEYSTKADLMARTQKILHTGGNTETSAALKLVRESVFTAAHGVRANVAHVVIVITDGRSQRVTVTRDEAAQLKASGATVFAIGVGSATDKQELTDIASSPSSQFVFSLDGFDAFDSIKNLLAIRACGYVPPN